MEGGLSKTEGHEGPKSGMATKAQEMSFEKDGHCWVQLLEILNGMSDDDGEEIELDPEWEDTEEDD